MDMGRGEGRVRCMERVHITICKIDSQQEFAEWLRNINLEEWDGEGDGGRFKREGL